MPKLIGEFILYHFAISGGLADFLGGGGASRLSGEASILSRTSIFSHNFKVLIRLKNPLKPLLLSSTIRLEKGRYKDCSEILETIEDVFS